jgi:hypothetical protein
MFRESPWLFRTQLIPGPWTSINFKWFIQSRCKSFLQRAVPLPINPQSIHHNVGKYGQYQAEYHETFKFGMEYHQEDMYPEKTE